MSTENQTNPDNGRIYGAEVQHKISLAAMTSDDAVRARALLSSIGFNPESRANKVMLLINPDTVAAIQMVFRLRSEPSREQVNEDERGDTNPCCSRLVDSYRRSGR